MATMKLHLLLLALLFSACVTYAAPSPQPRADKAVSAAPAASTGTISAVGIGIDSLTKSQNFYAGVMGYSRGTTMSFGNWDEIIMNPRANGPAIIPMKFKDKRSTKDLPVKLQFSCPDPKALLAKIVASGGKAVETMSPSKTGVSEGTLYAKDPDGYLLELQPGGTGIGLTSVGYGSSNLTGSGAFWSHLSGGTAGQIVKTEMWDILTVSTRKKMSVQFLNFKDERPTKHLPLKIVWAVGSIPGFKSTITSAGGKVAGAAQVGALSGFVGMANDPVDDILIEINTGGG